jgi:hypothetical protein
MILKIKEIDFYTLLPRRPRQGLFAPYTFRAHAEHTIPEPIRPVAARHPASSISGVVLVDEGLRNGAGGGNRTHGLGIMRPSLYH